jgi:hypothetical protein
MRRIAHLLDLFSMKILAPMPGATFRRRSICAAHLPPFRTLPFGAAEVTQIGRHQPKRDGHAGSHLSQPALHHLA